MINIKINRTYYIEAEAPAGYLFTGGFCNNAIPGWTCPKPITESLSAVGQESAIKNLHQERESYGEKFINGGEDGRQDALAWIGRDGSVVIWFGGYESGGCMSN